MTNFERESKGNKDTATPGRALDALSSPFDRALAAWRKRRLDKAAKRTACLTHCGKFRTPDRRALDIGMDILFESLTLALGLIFLWFNAVFFFLQNEKVDLTAFKPSAALWFSDKFAGQSADLESLTVEYRKDSGGFALVAQGAQIKDASNEALLALPLLDSEFDPADLIFGRFIPKRTLIEGGAATAIWRADGTIQFALGKPESVERLGADFNINSRRSRGSAGPDWRNIESVNLRNVDVWIIDDAAGAKYNLAQVSGEYVYDDGVLSGDVSAVLPGDDAVPLTVNFSADDDFDLIKVTANAKGLNPATLNADTGGFTALASLNAPLDADFDISLINGREVQDLSAKLRAGEGAWAAKAGPAAFKSALIEAKYNAASRQIDIKTAALQSGPLSFTGSGTVTAADAQTPLALKNPFILNLNMADISASPGEGFNGPFAAKSLVLNTQIDPVFRSAIINELAVVKETFTLSLSGDVAGKPQDGPFELQALNLKGKARGALTEADVLKYWPETLAPLSRAWVKRSILQADVPDIEFQTNLTAASLERGRLTDEELTMSFPIRKATVKFISTMTPMTNASGSGILRGNSFSVGVDAAKLGPQIDITDSRVDIPAFFPLGNDMTITVNGRGPITPLLDFIDEPPFGYSKRFGLVPAEFSGNGAINYVFTRPVGMPDRPDLITHTVSADFTDVTAPVKIGPHSVQNGNLHLDLDASGLRLFGPVNVGPWPAQFSLTDSFEDGSGNADYRLAGRMTRDDFDRLGIGFRQYFTGDVDVIIEAMGNGLSVNGAMISADLTDADLKFGQLWSKPAGQPGSLSAMVERAGDGSAQISDLSLTAEGLDVQGGAKFGSDLRLLSLNLPVTKVDGLIDSAIIASTPAAGELALTMRGAYLNIEPWVAAALSAQAQAGGFAMGLSGDFDRLNVRNGMALSGAKLGVKNSSEGLTGLNISGDLDAAPLSAVLTSEPDGSRVLTASIPDAGGVMKGILEFDNMRGGLLRIDAVLPPPGAPGPMSGTAQVKDFKLVNAPVFARILTLASLTGLGEVLSGDGMNFDILKVPFDYEEQSIRMTEARASGPAMGITASGDIDFDGKTMDVNGVLVPAYTFNSVLGNVPLLGDIVVGKEGEGIFALNYSVDGPFDKTQIAVNPLSAFAPGFLRRIFDEPLAQKAVKRAGETPPAQPDN